MGSLMAALESDKVEVEIEVTVGGGEDRWDEEPEEGENDEAELKSVTAEVEFHLRHYSRLQGPASVEGLNNVAVRAASTMLDFVLKVVNNIRVSVFRIFKDLKRSELEGYLHKNMTKYALLKRANYSQIYKTAVSHYPFTETPHEISQWLTSTFSMFDMKKRVVAVIEGYKMMSAQLNGGDVDAALLTMGRLNELNSTSLVGATTERLKKAVVAKIPRTFSTIGSTFNSVDELSEAVELVLRSSGELDNAMGVGGYLGKLYSTFEKLGSSLKVAHKQGANIGKLKGVTDTIHGSASLIEAYAMSVKEYTHLEHWLTGAIDASIKAVRADT